MDVEFIGKSAHAGKEPERGRNALLAAATATLQLHSVSRHSRGATRINVGTLTSGQGRNAIADYAKMEIETRGERAELNAYMEAELKRIVEGTAQMYGVDYRLDEIGHATSCESDSSLAKVIQSAISQLERVHTIHEYGELGASEDATLMMENVQNDGGTAAYLVFGTDLKEGHHHPSFDYDEASLRIGCETYLNTIMALQGER